MTEHSRPDDSLDSDQHSDQTERVDPLADDFQVGDPVVDLATGRTMLVVDRVADRTDEHSEREGFDFLENTGNERLRTSPADPVFECVYVTSVSSTPSKSYDFPSSRLGRPQYENVDGVRRVNELVAIDLLERLFDASDDVPRLAAEASAAGVAEETIDVARELASVEETIPDGGD